MRVPARWLVAVFATGAFSASVQAQTGCTLGSLTNKGWSVLPSKVAFDADASDVTRARLDSAREAWTKNPHCANSLPSMTTWDSSQSALQGDTEVWVVKKNNLPALY